MKSIRELLGLCCHQWKTIDKISVYAEDSWSSRPMYTKYVQQCVKCGTIKIKKT